MSYYLEPDSHIRDHIKVRLHLSNYATNKELKYVAGFDISNSAIYMS